METHNHLSTETLWSYKLKKKLSLKEHTLLIDKVEKILSAEIVNMLKSIEQRVNEETDEIIGEGAISLDIKFVDPEQPQLIFKSVKMHK